MNVKGRFGDCGVLAHGCPFAYENDTGRCPSAENIFLAAIGTEPKVLPRSRANRKPVVLNVDPTVTRRLEFHQSKGPAWLVE